LNEERRDFLQGPGKTWLTMLVIALTIWFRRPILCLARNVLRIRADWPGT